MKTFRDLFNYINGLEMEKHYNTNCDGITVKAEDPDYALICETFDNDMHIINSSITHSYKTNNVTVISYKKDFGKSSRYTMDDPLPEPILKLFV